MLAPVSLCRTTLKAGSAPRFPPQSPISLTFRVVRRSRFALGLALLHAGRLQGLHAVAGWLPGVSQALDGSSLLAKATMRGALPGNSTARSCDSRHGLNDAGGEGTARS